MFKKDNTLYAGISNENGANLNIENTGYLVQRITDGEKLGSIYEMQEGEDERMFIEILDESFVSPHFVKNNVIIAGVKNEYGFDLCIQQKDLYTSRKFIRIHDGVEMGNKISLGIDYSYDKKGRKDLPMHYLEVEEQR